MIESASLKAQCKHFCLSIKILLYFQAAAIIQTKLCNCKGRLPHGGKDIVQNDKHGTQSQQVRLLFHICMLKT